MIDKNRKVRYQTYVNISLMLQNNLLPAVQLSVYKTHTSFDGSAGKVRLLQLVFISTTFYVCVYRCSGNFVSKHFYFYEVLLNKNAGLSTLSQIQTNKLPRSR